MHFKAPWSRLLIGVSIFATMVCLVASFAAWAAMTRAGGDSSKWWAALLPALMIVGAALFTIRGYTIERDSILVHRLLWATRLSRTGLKSATHDPAQIAGGIRIFGNGGFFSFSGWFRNKHLGTYRAYITDPSLAVVLRYGDRVVVVSPAEPERFASAVMGER
ncbi:MAG: PH domain-containing protein [Candidatus Krumholzibacteria bacterium]|nr:PH domain-containing protein [Candidatus Krumholzibacteria bacterium]MDH4338697.1 PH domain-containing protein [Candidatus Krumholzibacteria bacterium]MDH5271388.1 PH domain-containing protein [Candidatus Krumholzibacteria bacterium]